MTLSGLECSGRVCDENGKPIDNVVITTKNRAFISNINGNFFLNNVREDEIITFHKIGFKDLTFRADRIPYLIKLSRRSVPITGIQISERKNKQELLETSDKITIKIKSTEKYNNAADILKERADLVISGTPLLGEEQTASIPGYKPRHTLVMIDGIPLNQSGKAFDISSIPAEIIESIEIIKGASSSQEGLGSMGAIININTKSAIGKFSSSIEHSFGSFGLDKTSMVLSGSISQYQAFIFLAKSFSRNDFKYEPRDYWENPDSLRTRINNEKEIFDVDISLANSNSFCLLDYKFLFQDFFKKLPGPTNNPELYKDSRLTGRTYRHILKFSKNISNYLLLADLYYNIERTKYDNTRIDEPYCNYLDYYVLGKHYQNSGGGKLKFKYQEQNFYFDWGGNYRYENFEYRELTDEDDSIPKVFQDNYSLFANSKLSQDIFPYSLILFLSGRWDFTSKFKDFGSWKISPECSYENVFKLIVGGSAGNGFTIPSFYNLYWKGDSQAMGNPDLIPEESLSWQVFSKVELYDNFIKISYRHDDIDNMIIWFQNFNYTWKPTNLSAAEVSNYEIEAEINLFQFLKLAGTYIKTGAFDRTRNEDGSQTSFYGKKIIYTPDFAMNLNINLTYKDLNCRISYSKTGEQCSTRDQLTEEKQLPAYELVDVNVFYSKQLRKFEIKTGIRANNIFDKLYEIYEYIPQPGFNWEVSIKIEYKI